MGLMCQARADTVLSDGLFTNVYVYPDPSKERWEAHLANLLPDPKRSDWQAFTRQGIDAFTQALMSPDWPSYFGALHPNPAPLVQDFCSVTITTHFDGGIGGDNWSVLPDTFRRPDGQRIDPYILSTEESRLGRPRNQRLIRLIRLYTMSDSMSESQGTN
jgi:hypothetical protein